MIRYIVIFLTVFQTIPLSSSLQSFFKIGQEERELTDKIFQRISPKDAGALYQMLELVDFLFTKHNIPYWIDSGTALGVVRHGGLIPWDNDVDLVFFIEDESRIFALKQEFAKYGFILRKRGILRLTPKGKSKVKCDMAGYRFFPSDGTYRFANERGRKKYPHYYWLPHEIYPLTRVQFGPVTLNAPNQLMPFVYRTYGKDCMTKAVYRSPPKLPNAKPMVKVRIVDFSPAKYIKSDLHLQ